MPALPANERYACLPLAPAGETVRRWGEETLDWQPVFGRWHDCAPAIETWVLQQVEDQLYLGLVSVLRQPERESLAFALWIAPPFREQGHATAAGRLILAWAFAGGFRRVESAHPMPASGAAQLAERLGMLPEGVQRGAYRDAQGEPVDVAHWGLLDTDR